MLLFDSMTGSRVPDAVQADWQALLNQAWRLANERANQFRWRGAEGGLLPSGYDAEAIAAEAVFEFLQLPASTRPGHPSRECHKLLRRLVWKQVDRLHRRKENLLLRNEADLTPVTLDDGETVSFLETVPDPGENPLASLIRKEDDAQFEAVQQQFRRFLGRDRSLNSLLTCNLSGIRQPRLL